MANEHVSMTLDVLPGTFGGIIAAIAGFNELVSSATTLAGAVGKSTSAVESMALTAGVALAGAAAAAASSAGEFDRSMKLVQAVSGQSAAEISVLTQRAKEFTSQYKVGIDKVISPERTAAGFLEKIITRPNVADLTAFGAGNAEILDMTIKNKKIFGKKVSELSPTKDNIIISKNKENHELDIPQPDDILNEGDKISILVKRGAFGKAEKKFMDDGGGGLFGF